MCQPHQLWIFPHFSRVVGGGEEEEGQGQSRRLLQSAMMRGEMSEEEYMALHSNVERFHGAAALGGGECRSLVAKRILAPVGVVWSVVRRFDRPQAYKNFISSCSMSGDGNVGSTREVRVVSGLPAARSTELLEILDEEHHVLSFRVLGGDHRLHNYRSVTTLHHYRPPAPATAAPVTFVIESYVVDVPLGNSRDDTRLFVDTIVRCNLQSLAHISEGAARHLTE
ncbi:abscisic acid receptor PYL4 [Cryptomeria japonica]|uniref:abscisic acid receptor PYL4 n=1 Tax=Cryptomeria japonica TaxID=3369 RepID=UPI0025AD8518|nr:abscisic acid receptor PYL4 [Cryptomeria japonica]